MLKLHRKKKAKWSDFWWSLVSNISSRQTHSFSAHFQCNYLMAYWAHSWWQPPNNFSHEIWAGKKSSVQPIRPNVCLMQMQLDKSQNCDCNRQNGQVELPRVEVVICDFDWLWAFMRCRWSGRFDFEKPLKSGRCDWFSACDERQDKGNYCQQIRVMQYCNGKSADHVPLVDGTQPICAPCKRYTRDGEDASEMLMAKERRKEKKWKPDSSAVLYLQEMRNENIMCTRCARNSWSPLVSRWLGAQKFSVVHTQI